MPSNSHIEFGITELLKLFVLLCRAWVVNNNGSRQDVGNGKVKQKISG
ncbi:hypothetical protein [Endozoicomonas montiporae]|nr:hypothetical protein [Endozoicomonas montiporae]